jgi:hypothetical protein
MMTTPQKKETAAAFPNRCLYQKFSQTGDANKNYGPHFIAENPWSKATRVAWNASTCLTCSRYFGVVLRAFANTGLAGDVR